PPYQPSPTRCPTFHSVTSSPIASTRPTTSCPGTRGYVFGIGTRPSLVTESLWQIPQACTRTRTSPAFGSGTSRVTSSIGPPFLATCAYRPVNFAIATSPSNDGRTSPGGRPRLGLTGIALVGPADRVASMRARVEHRLDRSVLLPDHEDVVAVHDRLDEVTPLGDLGFVAQEQPRAPGDQLHLPLEDRRVRVDAGSTSPRSVSTRPAVVSVPIA